MMRDFPEARVKPIAIGFVVFLLSALTFAQHYTQNNLVSNIPGVAPVTDSNLQNPWGLVASSGSPWWVSNNAGGTSTLYDGAGAIVPLVVTVPNAPSQPAPGSPTGVMFNQGAEQFLLAPGAHAIFMFVTEDGTISGWNPKVAPTTAVIKVDHSQVPNAAKGAVYKGATIVDINGDKFILAANFRSGRIDVFDSSFTQVKLSEDAFDDDQIPRDFAPFNVQAMGDNVYVTYAKQDAAKHDPVGGAGRGFIDVFTPKGRLRQRLQHGSFLNAPWGIVLTTANFGEFSHALLVGQFRGGTIAAFNPVTGRFLGNVQGPDGADLNIDGLWALVFANNNGSGDALTLYFTAGPNGEKDGLLGTLTPTVAKKRR